MFKNGMRPVHPGEILLEEFLKPLSLDTSTLAQALGISRSEIDEILREERQVTAEIALRLSRAFGTSAEFWMNLQSAYSLRVTELKMAKAQRCKTTNQISRSR
jgi:addiction module HigA family antidote